MSATHASEPAERGFAKENKGTGGDAVAPLEGKEAAVASAEPATGEFRVAVSVGSGGPSRTHIGKVSFGTHVAPAAAEVPDEPVPSARVISRDGERLVEEYGPLILRDAGGSPVFNQMHAAAKFAAETGILYDRSSEAFWTYDEGTGCWRERREDDLLIELGRALKRLLLAAGVPTLLSKLSRGTLQAILGFLKGVAGVPEAFASREVRIHVSNGVLEWNAECGEFVLREFRREDRSRNRTELPYDPAAECPRFLKELLGPVLLADDIAIIQRYGGQCILNRNHSGTILLMHGAGGTGKSTLENIIEAVIGGHNVHQLRVGQLARRFETSAFVGKTLLSGKDVPFDFLNNGAAHVLKALTGNDLLHAEKKGLNRRFPIRGEFNVIITANARLHVSLQGDESAWGRRLLVVEFRDVKPAKAIPGFDRLLLEAEGPGILTWFVHGAAQLLRELKATGRVTLTEEQRKRVVALLEESASVDHFLREEVQAARGHDVTVSELFRAYHDFCQGRGWRPFVERKFQNLLGDLMMGAFRTPRRTDIQRETGNQRGFKHVALKSVIAAEEVRKAA